MLEVNNVFDIEVMKNSKEDILVFNTKPIFRKDIDAILDMGWKLYNYGTGLLVDKTDKYNSKFVKMSQRECHGNYEYFINHEISEIVKDSDTKYPYTLTLAKSFNVAYGSNMDDNARVEFDIRSLESRVRLDARFYYPLYPYGVDIRNKSFIYSPVYIIQIYGRDGEPNV